MAATFDEGDKMRRWKRAMRNPRDALRQIGTLMVAESQLAFKKERFGKDRWEPRANPSVYGIIADFHAGRKPAKRRFRGRPVLHDTGNLRNTIAYRVQGPFFVEVGSKLPYAGVLHHGGPIKSKPIQPIRKALAAWLGKQRKSLRKKIGWLFADKFSKGLTGRVEPRPFVGVTKQTYEDVEEIVGVAIMEVSSGRVKRGRRR